MSTIIPNRVPAGVPAGGQFAPGSTGESPVGLTSTGPAAHHTGSEDEFTERFDPQTRQSGDLYDFEDVRDLPPERVWTITEDGETGSLYADPGFHVVNRIGYVTSQTPWTDETRTYYWYEEEPDDEDSVHEDYPAARAAAERLRGQGRTQPSTPSTGTRTTTSPTARSSTATSATRSSRSPTRTMPHSSWPSTAWPRSTTGTTSPRPSRTRCARTGRTSQAV